MWCLFKATEDGEMKRGSILLVLAAFCPTDLQTKQEDTSGTMRINCVFRNRRFLLINRPCVAFCSSGNDSFHFAPVSNGLVAHCAPDYLLSVYVLTWSVRRRPASQSAKSHAEPTPGATCVSEPIRLLRSHSYYDLGWMPVYKYAICRSFDF